MRFRWIFAALAIIATRSPARADAPLHALSLDSAVKLALAHNPDSQSVDQDVAFAEGGVRQVRALPNPSVFMGVLGTNLSPLDAPLPNQVGVTWTVPIGGKRAAAIAGARADLAGAEATRMTARRQLAFTVQSQFVALLLDDATLDFARKDRDGLRATLELLEVRYKDGKIAYGDVLKLRIQARGADDTVRQAEQTMAADRAELARLVGEGVLADDFVIEGDLVAPAPIAPMTAAELYAQALAHRSDYQASKAGEQSATAALLAARRAPIPDLGVLLDYNRIPHEAGSIDFSLTVAVPVFDRNRGAIQQAEATRRKASLATASLQAQIRADAARAVQAWDGARARLALYDEELFEDAKESLDISKHAYESGRGSLLDFLDAEASYRAVDSAYHTAVAEAVLAAAQLRFVAGEDSP